VADPAIERLHLTGAAKAGAVQLKKKFPSIVFLSGKRSVPEQAHAMAANIVARGNRKFIRDVYKASSARTKLQNWVDQHPQAKTVDAIAAGLEKTLNAMEPNERHLISKHLTGEAFDVQPPSHHDADRIKAAMEALPGRSFFTTSEGGLPRWHVQF
jgi:hypothetical protein